MRLPVLDLVRAFVPATMMFAATAQAQVAKELIPENVATGGNTIGTFAYDPSRDEAYVSSYQAGGAVRKITNVSSGTQSSAIFVSESQLQMYYRDGDTDRSVSTPLQSGSLLNPLPVGAKPAYSFAVIADLATTKLPASNTNDPAATKRIYSYSLQAVPTGGDGRDVYSTIASLNSFNAAAGIASTNSTSNMGRQFAWSGDGQSIYVADSSNPLTAVGGIWKVGVAGGTPVRLLADEDLLTEPAVVRTGTTDKIYFRGGESTGNLNGIDYITHDGVTTSTRKVAVSAAALRDFLELPANAAVSVTSMSSDADGNVYFSHSSGASASTGAADSRGLYKLDPQGRLTKVVSFAERAAVLGANNSNMNRQQTRTITVSGTGGPFPITQVMYAESGLNSIAAADVFRSGDFNRDNLVNDADINLFKQQVTTRGVKTTDVAKYKFDVNGNNGTDWKDVKILQPFFDYGHADVDLNGLTDFDDFLILRDNYGTTNKAWIAGDLTGDNQVSYPDFELLRDHFGYRSSIIGLGLQPAPFDAAEWDRFANSVPEPAAIGVLGLLCTGLLARRRRVASSL